MRTSLSDFRKAEDGAALAEMTIVMLLIILVLAAFVELTFTIYYWNQATKALQYGARLASVSDPVDTDMWTIPPGTAPTPLSIGDVGDRTCNSKTQTCSGGGTYNSDAMDRLIYGSDYDEASPVCGITPNQQQLGMCDVFPALDPNRLNPATIVVTYGDAGLGYEGRTAGAIPVITITIEDLELPMPILGSLLALPSLIDPRFGGRGLTFPPFSITATAEDLRENVL